MSTDSPREPSQDSLVVEETIAGVRRRVALARVADRSIGLVPTMGALHAGHLSLIEAARERCHFVVVSIFVNPTQFGPKEDFDRYPRPLDADLDACRQAGVDLVFRPSNEEMYPLLSTTAVEVGLVSDMLEGAIRPGHFRGVATVVLKLFNIVQPDVAFFGAKDYQQQLLIRRMVQDLNVPVEIDTRPTIREPDGLAMSSRNRYLNPEERKRASALSRALFAGRDRLIEGELVLARVELEMRTIMEEEGLTVDYATIRDPETLRVIQRPQSKMVLLVAARLGNVRLIDNLEVTLP